MEYTLTNRVIAELSKKLEEACNKSDNDLTEIFEFERKPVVQEGNIVGYDFSYAIGLLTVFDGTIQGSPENYPDGQSWDDETVESELYVEGLTHETESSRLFIDVESGEIMYHGAKRADFSEILMIELQGKISPDEYLEDVKDTSVWGDDYLDKTQVAPFTFSMDVEQMFER